MQKNKEKIINFYIDFFDLMRYNIYVGKNVSNAFKKPINFKNIPALFAKPFIT